MFYITNTLLILESANVSAYVRVRVRTRQDGPWSEESLGLRTRQQPGEGQLGL